MNGKINTRKPPVRNAVNMMDSFRDCLIITRGFVLSIPKFNSPIEGSHPFATHSMLINSIFGSKCTQHMNTEANWAIKQLSGVIHLYSYCIPIELKFNVGSN